MPRCLHSRQSPSPFRSLTSRPRLPERPLWGCGAWNPLKERAGLESEASRNTGQTWGRPVSASVILKAPQTCPPASPCFLPHTVPMTAQQRSCHPLAGPVTARPQSLTCPPFPATDLPLPQWGLCSRALECLSLKSFWPSPLLPHPISSCHRQILSSPGPCPSVPQATSLYSAPGTWLCVSWSLGTGDQRAAPRDLWGTGCARVPALSPLLSQEEEQGGLRVLPLMLTGPL